MRSGRLFIFVMVAGLCPISGALALDWHTERSTDSFTDEETCRVVPGAPFGRALMFGMLEGVEGWYSITYFFAERRGSEVRAGFTNDKQLPIASDIQVRVDQNPAVTITAADTPIDFGPKISIPDVQGITPEVKEQIEKSIRTAMAYSSPYRVLVGEKAVDLLRQIVNGRRAIWRAERINSADQEPSEIKIDGLRPALNECGIVL